MSTPTPQNYPVLPTQPSVKRRTLRWLPWLAVTLVIASSLFVIVTMVPHAIAEELAPDALGTIAGVVRNTQGEPLAGLKITLSRNNQFGRSTIITGADGAYRFSNLAPSLYRLKIEDPNGFYPTIYYPAGARGFQAGTIPIAGNQRTDVDLTLEPASQIMGNITAANVFTTGNIMVQLYERITVTTGVVWEEIQSMVVPIPVVSSPYTFTALPAATYRICAKAEAINSAFNFMLYECFDDAYGVSRATDIVLTGGTTISNVNLALGDSVDYAQISGQVLAPDQTPLANIAVHATTAQDAPVYSAQTDSQGTYHLSLVPGRYTLQFRDPIHQYADEYYQDAWWPEAATSLDLALRQTITHIDAQLETAGQIVGLFSVLGQPPAHYHVGNSFISTYRKTANGWQFLKYGEIDPNTGAYQIRGLPAGSYRVQAYSRLSDGNQTGAQGYTYTGYYGGQTAESATEITLTGGQTQTANIDLTAGAQFEGSITGRITAGGVPLANAKVSLYRGRMFGSEDVLNQIVYVFTDAEGRYTINGLAQDAVQIGAADPAEIYATTYYTAQIGPLRAEIVQVTDGQATTGIDIDLPLGGAISGRITQKDGTPVANLVGKVYNLDLTYTWNGSTNFIPINNELHTDRDGRYRIAGLHPGPYMLCFNNQNREDWWSECYTGNFQVVAGSTTNLDLLWRAWTVIYLPLVKQ